MNKLLPKVLSSDTNSSSIKFDINSAKEEVGKKYLFGCASSDTIDSFNTVFSLPILKMFVEDCKQKNIIVETYHQDQSGYKFVYAIGNVIDAYITNMDGINKLFIKVEINQRSPMATWIWHVVLKPDLDKGEPDKLGFSIDTRVSSSHYEMIGHNMIEIFDVGRLVRVAVLEAPSNPDAYAIAVTRSIKENKQGDLVKIVFNNIENKENILMENIVEQAVVEPTVEAKEETTEVRDTGVMVTEPVTEVLSIPIKEATEEVQELVEEISEAVQQDCPYCKANIDKIIEAMKLAMTPEEKVETRSILEVEKSLNENLESNLKSVEQIIVRSILESFETKTKGISELVSSTINSLTESVKEQMLNVDEKIVSLNNLMGVIASQPVGSPARQVNLGVTQTRSKAESSDETAEQICKSYLQG